MSQGSCRRGLIPWSSRLASSVLWHHPGRTAAVTVLVLLAVTSCDDDTSPAATGSLRIEAVTTNPELASNGYTVIVDYGAGVAIDASGSVTFAERSLGNHRIELTGVDPRCKVFGDNPRLVVVSTGGTTIAAFEVGCFYTGDLEVTTTTVGLGPDSYEFSVDGGDPQTIGREQTVRISGLTLDVHSVLLTVPLSCTIGIYYGEEIPNPKAARVPPGDPGVLVFPVTCDAL